MPRKERILEMNRVEFAKQVFAKKKSKRALCREYEISRPTGDQ